MPDQSLNLRAVTGPCRHVGRAALLLILAAAVAAPAAAADLERVLERLARAADLYRDEALGFTCNESIHYSDARRAVLRRFRYIYRRSPDGELQEYREPLRAASRGPDAHSASALPLGAMFRPYSWMFVFAREKREAYRYELEGEQSVLGRRTLRVRFDAVEPYVQDINEFYGTAYVDLETFQPVRVEAYRVNDRHRLTRYTTDFDVVKNGMRFPGQVRIAGGLPRFAVVQTYKRYSFFNVRARDEIMHAVLGDDVEH